MYPPTPYFPRYDLTPNEALRIIEKHTDKEAREMRKSFLDEAWEQSHTVGERWQRGTVFGLIGKTDFQQVAKPMNDKTIENCIQIQTLENLRDALLPKLVSGKIRAGIRNI